MTLLSLKTDKWTVVVIGWAVILKRRASGEVRIMPRSKMPDWRDLYTMSRSRFDLICIARFHGRA